MDKMNPTSRRETLYNNIIKKAKGEELAQMPLQPYNREEQYLNGILESIEQGGGSLRIVIVDELPEIGESSVLYLVKKPLPNIPIEQNILAPKSFVASRTIENPVIFDREMKEPVDFTVQFDDKVYDLDANYFNNRVKEHIDYIQSLTPTQKIKSYVTFYKYSQGSYPTKYYFDFITYINYKEEIKIETLDTDNSSFFEIVLPANTRYYEFKDSSNPNIFPEILKTSFNEKYLATNEGQKIRIYTTTENTYGASGKTPAWGENFIIDGVYYGEPEIKPLPPLVYPEDGYDEYLWINDKFELLGTKEIAGNIVLKSDIVNNLVSIAENKPLAANMGRELKLTTDASFTKIDTELKTINKNLATKASIESLNSVNDVAINANTVAEGVQSSYIIDIPRLEKLNSDLGEIVNRKAEAEELEKVTIVANDGVSLANLARTEIESLKSDTAVKFIDVNEGLLKKVEKVAGKDLSTNDYTTIEKNKLNSVETGAQENIIESITVNNVPSVISNKNISLEIPTNNNQLINGSKFQSDTEVQALINSAIGSISSIEFKIVAALPITGEANIIYLVPNGATTENVYNEYIWVNFKFEKIGSTDIDLSGYLKKQDVINDLTTGGSIKALSAEQGKVLNNTIVMHKDEANNKFVIKVDGKALSTNDYTTAEKTKLLGIAINANNYIHPNTHLPSIIEQNSLNRFVTDAEKTLWNAKADPTKVYTKEEVNGMVAAAKTLVIPNLSIDSSMFVIDTNTTYATYPIVADIPNIAIKEKYIAILSPNPDTFSQGYLTDTYDGGIKIYCQEVPETSVNLFAIYLIETGEVINEI